MTRMTLKTFTTSALGALALTAAAMSAHASEVVTTTVERDRLATPAGIEAVHAELSDVAESACTQSPPRTLQDRGIERACRDKLLQDFIDSAAHEGLTGYHDSVTK